MFHSTTKKIVLVGTGDLAKGLAHMSVLNASHQEDFEVVAAEPLPNVRLGNYLLERENAVPVVDFKQAIATGDVLILCIPAYAIEKFLLKSFNETKDGVVIVDPSNSSKKRDDVESALEELHMENFDRWVKAFNDNGAIKLLATQPFTKEIMTTNLCGPQPLAVSQVKDIAKNVFGFAPKVIPFELFDKVRATQYSIGTEWIHSIILMVGLWVLTMVYVVFWKRQRPSWEPYEICTRGFSSMFAWSATYGLSLSLLPGVQARLYRQVCGPVKMPSLLLWGLGIRKHVGLISLYFLSLHACIMLLIFGQVYYSFILRADETNTGKMRWMGEASMLFACLSFSLFIIVGLASLPSIQSVMNKAQFQLVFGPVVWVALCFGLAHIMVLGEESWHEKDENPFSWAGDMPPVTLMASLIPLLVLALKFLQVSHSLFQRTWRYYRGGRPRRPVLPEESVVVPEQPKTQGEVDV